MSARLIHISRVQDLLLTEVPLPGADSVLPTMNCRAPLQWFTVTPALVSLAAPVSTVHDQMSPPLVYSAETLLSARSVRAEPFWVQVTLKPSAMARAPSWRH